MSLKTCQEDSSKTCIVISNLATLEDEYIVEDEALESNLDTIDAASGHDQNSLIKRNPDSCSLYVEIDNTLLTSTEYRDSLSLKLPLLVHRATHSPDADAITGRGAVAVEIFCRKHGLIAPSTLFPKDESAEHYFQVTVPAEEGYALAAMDLTQDADGNAHASGIVTIVDRDEEKKTITLEITVNQDTENDEPSYKQQLQAISAKATEFFRGLLPTKQPVVTQVQKNKHTESLTQEYFPGLYGASDNVDARYQKEDIRIAMKLKTGTYEAVKRSDTSKNELIVPLADQSDSKYTTAAFNLNLVHLLDTKNYDEYKSDTYNYAHKALEDMKGFLTQNKLLPADGKIEASTIGNLPYAVQNYLVLLMALKDHYAGEDLKIDLLSPFRKSIVGQLIACQSEVMTESRVGTGFLDIVPANDIKDVDQLIRLSVNATRLKTDAIYRKAFLDFANKSIWLLEDTLHKNKTTLDKISLVKADFLVNLSQFKDLALAFEYEASVQKK